MKEYNPNKTINIFLYDRDKTIILDKVVQYIYNSTL